MYIELKYFIKWRNIELSLAGTMSRSVDENDQQYSNSTLAGTEVTENPEDDEISEFMLITLYIVIIACDRLPVTKGPIQSR